MIPIDYDELVPGKFYRDVLPENDLSGTGQSIFKFIGLLETEYGDGPSFKYVFKAINNFDYYSYRLRDGNLMYLNQNIVPQWYYYKEDQPFKFGKNGQR